MSSTMSSKYSADKCIDGDIVGREVDGNMCHSHHNLYPWLAIDYGTAVTVDRVEIYNRRSACCGNRTKNVDVRISNKLPDSAHSMFSGGSLLGHFAGPAKKGQHILIKHPGQNVPFLLIVYSLSIFQENPCLVDMSLSRWTMVKTSLSTSEK